MEKLKYLSISNEDFSPKVLKSSLFTQGLNFPQGYKLNERFIYDYEIEYFLYSSGSMLINNQMYPIHQGDIVFRKPGQSTQGIMPYSCYLICFDLTGKTNKDPKTYIFDEVQEYQPYYLNSIIETIPPVFHVDPNQKYHFLFDSILQEFINPSPASDLLLKSYLLQIIYQLYHDISNPLTDNNVPISPHFLTLKKAIAYIQENFNRKLNLHELADLVEYSPSHFHKLFTNTMGITPNDFLVKTRLNKAKEMLVKTALSIADIAIQCGFENIPYFSYTFKKELNISPGEFRKKHSYK